jgi:hypothetical protein
MRLRHPDWSPLKRVTVNGQPWPDIDAKRETVRLPTRPGTLSVVAEY